ncbi:MAG: hypothetical protein P1V35_14035 [Planctomycetota bacterium]|nr:hypothetical protein [Planctomycetota bacterium]
MAQPVIALYTPRAGCESQLLELVRIHHHVLSEQGLVSDRQPYVLRSSNGTLLEIFEWKDNAAIEAAHTNPAVAELWQRFGAVAEYSSLKSLAEAEGIFPGFEHVDLG